MAKENVRVQIPTNPTELLKLTNLIYQKHTNDGAASPLKELEDDNWTDKVSKIADALELDAAVKKMEKDLENLYAQRNALIEPVKKTVLASRNLLLGKYSKSPKKLGDWHFVVDDSAKAAKKVSKAA